MMTGGGMVMVDIVNLTGHKISQGDKKGVSVEDMLVLVNWEDLTQVWRHHSMV